MIADGLVFRFSRNPPPGKWSHASIGLVNGGAIRTSLPQGNTHVKRYLNQRGVVTLIKIHRAGISMDMFFKGLQKAVGNGCT